MQPNFYVVTVAEEVVMAVAVASVVIISLDRLWRICGATVCKMSPKAVIGLFSTLICIKVSPPLNMAEPSFINFM